MIFQVFTPVVRRYNLRSQGHTPSSGPLRLNDSMSANADMGVEVKHLADIAARNKVKALRTVEYSQLNVSSDED
jgi:hypothetical protein